MEIFLAILVFIATILAIYYRDSFEKANLEILNLEERLDETKEDCLEAEKRATVHFKRCMMIQKELDQQQYGSIENLTNKIKEILANPQID